MSELAEIKERVANIEGQNDQITKRLDDTQQKHDLLALHVAEQKKHMYANIEDKLELKLEAHSAKMTTNFRNYFDHQIKQLNKDFIKSMADTSINLISEIDQKLEADAVGTQAELKLAVTGLANKINNKVVTLLEFLVCVMGSSIIGMLIYIFNSATT